jgi:putative membrane protein
MKRIGSMVAVAGLAVTLCGAAFAQNTKAEDKTFIKNATEGSLAEINFSKLALEKSKDANVRKFAGQMVEDHEKLINDVKPFAMKYDVKVSSAPLMDHAKYQELKLKSGSDFDRAYVELMVKAHHEDLQAFIDEVSKTADPALKMTVAKGEKVVWHHTEMIDSIAHMGGIQTPPMPNGN